MSATTTKSFASEPTTQTMWNEATQWWAAHLKEDKNRRREIFPTVLALLGDVRGRRILDAGCGEGSFSRLLAQAGAQVTGVDFSRLLDIAVDEELRRPQGIRYLSSDLRTLDASTADGGFDCVVCNLVLHCCPDIDSVLASLHGQLKPDGALVVSDLHPTTFPLYSKAWTTCIPTSGNEYKYTLSPECPPLALYLHAQTELENAFARNGFVCLEHRSPPAHASEHLEPGLPRFLYGHLKKASYF